MSPRGEVLLFRCEIFVNKNSIKAQYNLDKVAGDFQWEYTSELEAVKVW